MELFLPEIRGEMWNETGDEIIFVADAKPMARVRYTHVNSNKYSSIFFPSIWIDLKRKRFGNRRIHVALRELWNCSSIEHSEIVTKFP